MITVLLPAGRAAAGDVVPLEPAEVHHLRVRRAGEALSVQLRDGRGFVGTGLLRDEGGTVAVVVEQAEMAARPAPLRLAVAAADRDRFAWLVEKATELGVTDIFPIATERTAAVASRIREGQLARLRRRAFEAVKQCGTAWAPDVHPAQSLASLLGQRLEGARWLADANGRAVPSTFGAGPSTILVGPEGGLSRAEQDSAFAAGFLPVRLAEHVLRFETAALAAAACAAATRSGGANG
jgi:16S rRNA (uracil1498-N3)-methyltransferase